MELVFSIYCQGLQNMGGARSMDKHFPVLSIVLTGDVCENDESLSPYFGNVSFYFKATVVVDQKSKSHILSYIQWYKFRSKKVEPLSGLYTVKNKQFYQTDRIMSPRRFPCRCVLAATKPKAPYFFVSQLPKWYSWLVSYNVIVLLSIFYY